MFGLGYKRRLLRDIEGLKQEVRQFASAHQAATGLLNEATLMMSEHAAFARRNKGGTFKLGDLKPEYGNDWKGEESALNPHLTLTAKYHEGLLKDLEQLVKLSSEIEPSISEYADEPFTNHIYILARTMFAKEKERIKS